MLLNFTIYVIILFLIPFCYWVYFKIKNPFWGCQPVNQPHHFYRKFMKPFIISKEFYNHKFMNPLHIKSESWNTFISKNNESEFTNFIREHFCNNSTFKYLPTFENHIQPYFEEDKTAHISRYYINNILIGTITNRSAHIILPRNNKFRVSYIDFLCVHRGERNRNIAPELIQTHEFYQRTKTDHKYLVSLFKKEGRLHNFTPLVEYKTFTYNLPKQTKIPRSGLPTHLKLTWFSLSTFKNILPHIEAIQKTKDCFILPPIESILKMIERKSIQICGILDMNKNECIASYWFRDTGFYVNSEKANLECFASLCNKEKIDSVLFQNGFLEAILQISKNFNLLQMECTGDNCIISSMPWQKEYETPCAYYLYNYSHNSIKPEDITILI